MSFGINFNQALGIASDLHRAQKRKSSGAPYIGHLLAVASIVIEYKGSETEAIAALLHDAVEDQGGKDTEAAIRSVFGNDVADIVMACSDAVAIPKPPWKERKQHHIDSLEKASLPVLMVIAADKLSNMRMLLDDYRYACASEEKIAALWAPFKGGRDGSIWYYKQMALAIRRGCVAQIGFKAAEGTVCGPAHNILRIGDELMRTVEALEELVHRHETDQRVPFRSEHGQQGV